MDTTFSRRSFLKSAAFLPVAAAGGLGLGPGSNEARAETPIKRLGRPELRVALNAYSFARELDENLKNPSRGISLLGLLDFCAEHDIDAIDATGYYFPASAGAQAAEGRDWYPRQPHDDYLYRFKRRAFELGIAISGTGTRDYLITADKAVRRQGVANIKMWVEVASRMGATVLRVFADYLERHRSWKEAVPGYTHDQVQAWVADDLRECAEHGARHGVIVGVQNHGDFNGTAEQFLSLLDRVGSEWCGAVLDTGYFNTPDPYVDIQQVAPYAVNWQIKQSVFDGGYGATPIDLDRIVKIARAAGYRGYMPVETLYAKGQPHDAFKLVPPFIEKVKAAIAAAV